MSNVELNRILSKNDNNNASSSAEDLSEYTDADDSVSAPTEILAEFLSSIMMKDYEKALRYCTLILNYEPENATAKDFYPLIVEKLEMIQKEECDNSSESSESSLNSSSSSSLSSRPTNDCNENENKNKQVDSCETSASYSSLEDDEEDIQNNVVDTEGSENVKTDTSNENTDNNNLEPDTDSICQENNSTAELKEDIKNTKDTTDTKHCKEVQAVSIVSSSPKILIHSTPTVTLQQNPSFRLLRTKTYTKSFQSQNHNTFDYVNICQAANNKPKQGTENKVKNPTKKHIVNQNHAVFTAGDSKSKKKHTAVWKP